jgi:hypothetical protein
VPRIPAIPSAESVNWQALDGRSRELLRHVGLRLAQGQSNGQIASALNDDRPALQHLALPSVVSPHWVAHVASELRTAIVAAASTLSTSASLTTTAT